MSRSSVLTRRGTSAPSNGICASLTERQTPEQGLWSREGKGMENQTGTPYSTPAPPEMDTHTRSATRDAGASPHPRPTPALGPGPRPRAQTPTDGQPLQALAVLRRDGVPTREGRHVRGEVTGHQAFEGPGAAVTASGRHAGCAQSRTGRGEKGEGQQGGCWGRDPTQK